MLMVETDQTSKSIARKCGFSSLGHFSKAFRRTVGIKSQSYRKMRRSSRNLGESNED